MEKHTSMTTRSMGPGAGLSWLSRAVNLGRHSPRTIFGAIALLALVALVPSLVQAFAQHVLGLGPAESMGAIGVLSLVEPDWFPEPSVWSEFGIGYGFVPLALPVAGLIWLRRQKAVPK